MTEIRHIHVLPIHVANKIAAGEVVERPASVLKELVENSLDAGSTQIDVEIVSGGRKLLSVSDNGSGMNRDDAILSVERQATSKIRDVDDIEQIATLGFRGEALAAISSVSRFRLITCTANSATGTEIRITGGKMSDVQEIGCPVGTSMEVRDIFFNVPARRKFLRSYQTEQSYVRSMFMVLALANPLVGMSLKIDGREAYRLAEGSKLEERIRDLFGPDYVKNLVRVDTSGSEVKITGYVSLPALSRSDRTEQYVFVNGRATSAALISHGIKEGYHTLLPEKRQPSVFLFLTMVPDLVDVNVHPTKKEVRFRHPTEVRDTIIESIRSALSAGKTTGDDKGQVVSNIGPKPVIHRQLTIANLTELPYFKYPSVFGSDMSRRNESSAFPSGEIRKTEMVEAEAISDQQSMNETVAPSTESGAGAAADGVTSPWRSCRIVGQIGGLYVVLETEDGYVMMDPHAAHERILFEKFMSDTLKKKVQSQNLLIPETVELGPRDALRVRKNIHLLSDMGFGISEFGGDAFVVDALPSYFSGSSAKSLLAEIAHSLEMAGKRGGTERWREETVAQAACKTAVKARDQLDLKEIEKLVIDLASCRMPYTCPHGRPTMVFTSFKELHRKFGRE